MDFKTRKNLQNNYSREELEQMLKPDENMSPEQRLKEAIKNKRMRRSGLHNLKYNLQKRVEKNTNITPKKSRLEVMFESIPNSRLRTFKKSGVKIDAEEYTRCLGIANEYLQLEENVNVFEDIPELYKIGNDNIRNVFKKIVYYERYCQDNEEEIEELEI
ncbi:MAG: hypothetical protein IJ997_01095 [Mycoplasmataceae bacterium]|nr:hypothetical protein [Mycoplasmataceae bacterium]